MRRSRFVPIGFVIVLVAAGTAISVRAAGPRHVAPVGGVDDAPACRVGPYAALIRRHIEWHRQIARGERVPPASLAGGPVSGERRGGTGSRRRADSDPAPIPGGFGGGEFHVWAPGPLELGFMGVDVEPATITDFNGLVAMAYLTGSAYGDDGKVYALISDMRVMQGAYRSADGSVHHGTFALT